MFQIQCHTVCVCHQRGWLAVVVERGDRVQEAGQWEVRGGADVGETEYKLSKGGVSVCRSFWVLLETCQAS